MQKHKQKHKADQKMEHTKSPTWRKRQLLKTVSAGKTNSTDAIHIKEV